MDVGVVNPFIEAVRGTVRAMTGFAAERGKPFVHEKVQDLADIHGAIGLFGGVQGAVFLSFPADLARRLFEAMIGEPTDQDDPGIGDAVGEMTNITAGGAKKQLAGLGYVFQISTPTIGKGLPPPLPAPPGPCLVVPFACEGASFFLQITARTVHSA